MQLFDCFVECEFFQNFLTMADHPCKEFTQIYNILQHYPLSKFEYKEISKEEYNELMKQIFILLEGQNLKHDKYLLDYLANICILWHKPIESSSNVHPLYKHTINKNTLKIRKDRSLNKTSALNQC